MQSDRHLTLSQVLTLVRGTWENPTELGEVSSDAIQVQGIGLLVRAGSQEIAFFFSKEFQTELVETRPGILVTGKAFIEPIKNAGLPFWKKTAVVSCDQPYLAMALVSQYFGHIPRVEKGIHPKAEIASDAKISARVNIGAFCVVEDEVEIGEGTVLYPGCFVGRGTKIGSDCEIFSNVSLYEGTQIGNRVRIHAGAVVGSDGFGYAPRMTSGGELVHEKIFHFGSVIVGDDVEIGANTSIDRGTIGNTIIEKGAKIDNQVQVGHNCKIGESAIICGCSGLAGSAEIQKGAYVGGLTGVSNRVVIGAGAKVAAHTLVSKDIVPGGTAVGNPQRSQAEHFRLHAELNRKFGRRAKPNTKQPEKEV